MPNIGALLKEEISRLSRKEIRQQVGPFAKASATHRRHIAALKRQVIALTKQLSGLKRSSSASGADESTGSDAKPARFVAKGLVSLRARLGLSAADFAKLVGVSSQSIYNWEHKKASPRKGQLATLASLRTLGKREAEIRLEQGSAKPAAKGAGKTAKKAAKKSAKKAAKKGVKKAVSKAPAKTATKRAYKRRKKG